MGYGKWTDTAFTSYATSRGLSVSCDGSIVGDYSNQDMFKATRLDEALNPKNVIRECRDSDEHPNVVPVILALDVTGSMGQAAVEVAKKLNVIMTDLYKKVNDVQFLIMGIGDIACDRYPVQVSQFESDIRIADQLEKIYFEFGGGSNPYESYSLAWYFALNHTDIDAINKRGNKGIIITMGDECLNPSIPKKGYCASIESVFGDTLQGDIDTTILYEQIKDKFECYHIHVNHLGRHDHSFEYCGPTFAKVIGEDHVVEASPDDIADKITTIILENANKTTDSGDVHKVNGEIVW